MKASVAPKSVALFEQNSGSAGLHITPKDDLKNFS